MVDSHFPEHGATSFQCPYCRVVAHQNWEQIPSSHLEELYSENGYTYQGTLLQQDDKFYSFSICSHCLNPSFWLSDEMIYPYVGVYPEPNPDLSEDVICIYNEASFIAHQSPRAACALLRLALEMFLKDIGESGAINDAIKNLVKKGLSEEIQEALDTVRVTGNYAVHPGTIIFDEDIDVYSIFELLNAIAEELITLPGKRKEMYSRLPKRDRDNIVKRDGRSST